MSDLPSRRDAEDIANGTTLSGNSELVERIYTALLETWDVGQVEGFCRGYARAIRDMQGKLEGLAENAPSSTD